MEFKGINTERLLIRKLELSDSHSVFNYRSNKDVSKYQSFKPNCIEDVEIFIKDNTKGINISNAWFQLGIYEGDEIIGDIGIHFIGLENVQCEIGYTLKSEKQGKGYASEAVIAVIDYLFFDLKKRRITASVDPKNESSIRLLERIGFRRESYLKKSIFVNNEWKNDIQYGILAEEWDSLKKILLMRNNK